MEASEDMGQEDTDMAEADINKAEKAVAGADKEKGKSIQRKRR